MKRKIWTEKEDEILRELYPRTQTDEIAKRLNRSVRSVYSHATILKLSKDKDWLEAMNQRLGLELSQNPSSIANRRKKGCVPFNKGKKQTEYMSAESIEKSKKTRFKRGMISHNHKEIGYQRINKYGYIEVKVEEPNRFELLHRFMWKVWNDSIPPGHVISFIDGNKMNCDITNLKLLSMKENMKRNSIQRYPQNLRTLMQLQGKVESKIEKLK